MRWLHNLLHWRCDRELAQREAMIAALMPRYQPVTTPPGTVAERIERALASKEPEPTNGASEPGSRWPERIVEWKEPE